MEVGVLSCRHGAKAGLGVELGDNHQSLPVLEILPLLILTVSMFLSTARLTLQKSYFSIFSKFSVCTV